MLTPALQQRLQIMIRMIGVHLRSSAADVIFGGPPMNSDERR
jgi:hypothetical protein